MSEMPISPLRRRMLEDMGVRRFVPDTQREYIVNADSKILKCAEVKFPSCRGVISR
jgi:hypothetical protein